MSEILLSKPELKWTIQTPLYEGWYWCKNKRGFIDICRVAEGPNGLSIFTMHGQHTYKALKKMHFLTEWAGPIESPKNILAIDSDEKAVMSEILEYWNDI